MNRLTAAIHAALGSIGPNATREEHAQALAEAVAGCVEPLVWSQAHDNGYGGLRIVADALPYMGRYNIEWWPEKVILMVAGGEWVRYQTKAAAKDAAEAHHRAQILSALGIK